MGCRDHRPIERGALEIKIGVFEFEIKLTLGGYTLLGIVRMDANLGFVGEPQIVTIGSRGSKLAIPMDVWLVGVVDNHIIFFSSGYSITTHSYYDLEHASRDILVTALDETAPSRSLGTLVDCEPSPQSQATA